MNSREALYEVEWRFIVSELPALLARLDVLGAALIEESWISDDWFVPSWVTTHAEHEEWLDSANAAPVRVRSVSRNGESRSCLEVKRPVSTGSFDVCKEVSVDVDDAEKAGRVLEELSMRRLIGLRKLRKTYRVEEFYTCHIDEYDKSVVILEVEAMVRSPGDLPPRMRTVADYLSRGISCALNVSSAIYLIEMHLLTSVPGDL